MVLQRHTQTQIQYAQRACVEMRISMERILTSAEMKKCDEDTSKIYGIDSMVLMERAALETAKIIVEHYGTDISVGIVAGSGNNGGDGIAIARILKEYGVYAQIHIIGEEEKYTEQIKKQLEAAQALKIPIHYCLDQTLYDVIVDALLGIGVTRPVEKRYKEAVEMINASSAKVVSVDIPTGINADSGAIMNCAVKADITVTYAFRKLGQMLYPGCINVGKLICVPIGIPMETLPEKKSGVVTFSKNDLKMPTRNPGGNKGSFGKVLLIAGSKSMGGACQLAALSAFRIGAGMVRVFTAEENRDILLKRLPEIIVDTYRDDGLPTLFEDEKLALIRGLEWADVVAIGPGLSLSAKAKLLLEMVLNKSQKPLVIDADALNILSEQPTLMKMFEFGHESVSKEIVLTPHLGEFARLIKYPIPEIKKDILGYCKSFTKKYNVSLVCKDARTIVTKHFKISYLNNSGNDGMATAGSGDVLTGIIAGLIAQGMDSYEAAVMGTYAHGLAGDIAKKKSSAYYIMAQDIIYSLQNLYQN